MIEIRPVTHLNEDDLHRLVRGYIADAVYRVGKSEGEGQFVLTLELVTLPRPFVKQFDVEPGTLALYRAVPQHGFSFAAYDGDLCAGIALAEPHHWNQSLWVWEFHVAESHQRQGIGRQLMEALAQKAEAAGLRTIVCETQNSNVPAIRFYSCLGFHIEGIDLSYYSNNDFPDGEADTSALLYTFRPSTKPAFRRTANHPAAVAACRCALFPVF
jgi:streptothricin acetyltransferase